MANLVLRYGAMGSAKSAFALIQRFNLDERGRSVVLTKPGIDVRDGKDRVASRIGISAECVPIELLLNTSIGKMLTKGSIVIVDEAQFLTAEQADALSDLVDFNDVEVVCYGLRADFQNNLFPGSARLLAIADKIEEVETYCWCGRFATCNARLNETKDGIVRDGDQVVLGGSEKYISLCRKHYKTGQLGPNE